MILITLTQFQLALKDKVQDNHKEFIKEYKMTARAEVNERKVWYDKILKVWRYEDNHEIPELKDALTNKEDFTVATVNAQAERIKELEEQLKQKEDFANVIPKFDDLQESVKQIYIDMAEEILDDKLICTRVWEAWSVGTMTQDDFIEAKKDDDVVYKTAEELYKIRNIRL